MMLLCFFMTMAFAQMTTEIVDFQKASLPPHGASANLSSLPSWNANMGRGIIRKSDDQGKVFEFVTQHNSYGFRVTGKTVSASAPETHLFLSGCSWTYGTGIAGDKTFAAHLEAGLPRSRVVNMAARGGSPAEALYLWRNFNWPEVYPEPKGLLIFTLIHAHIERLKRTWRYLSWAQPSTPVFDEALAESRPLREFYDYKWAKFVKGLGLDYVWLRGTAHFSTTTPQEFSELMVRYLRAVKAEYLKRYPAGRFVVAWMKPEEAHFTDEELRSFKLALEEARIEHWQPVKPLSSKSEDYGIPRDGHPSELAHEEYAEFILRKMSDQAAH